MAVSLNSLLNFSSPLPAKHQLKHRSCFKTTIRATPFASPLGIYGSRLQIKDRRCGFFLSVADDNQVAADTKNHGPGEDETSLSNYQFSVASSPSSNVEDASWRQTTEDSNGSSVSPQKDAISSSGSKSKMKRSLLTAREKLRAAQVLNRYTETTKASKSEFGSRVLDILRESEKGKKESGLPEAPTNMLDDRDRGLSNQGLVSSFRGVSMCFLLPFRLFLSAL